MTNRRVPLRHRARAQGPDVLCDRSPLFSTAYDSGFGTLYTAAYRPAEGSVDYRWPSFSWRLAFSPFVEGEHTEVLAEGAVA